MNMKRISWIKYLPLWVLMAFGLQSCEEKDYEKIYGNGSPVAENVIPRENYIYEYNDEGLVTKISRYESISDGQGKEEYYLKLIADISYPQSNRAVMEYVEDGYPTTYTFAFGENHFANRMIESDAEGTYITYFDYDSEGHITSMECEGDKLELGWTNGNLTTVNQEDDHGSKTELTYTDLTDFTLYKMDPFLLDINLGPFAANLGWWFERGLSDALYIGFLGKHSRNLPATLVAYDDVNSNPERGEFEYYNYSGVGGWRYSEVYH